MSEALNNRQAEQKCKKDEVLADKGAKSKHEKRKSHVSPSSTDQQSADDDISAKNKTPNSRPEKRKRETSCSFVYVYSYQGPWTIAHQSPRVRVLEHSISSKRGA